MHAIALRFVPPVTALLLFGTAFQLQEMTGAEARKSLEESAVASQAEALTSAGIEVATSFTIGEAVANAAGEIRSLVSSQLPCAEVSVEQGRLSIEYGVHEGNCVYRGHSLSGMHRIEVEKNELDDVVVTHEWDALSNGKLSVTGNATVTWSQSERSRHVVHELSWTRLADGRMGVGSGNRTQTALPEGIATGFQVSGMRAWEGERGRWELEIDDVQMRWVDPVPQAGSYELDTPFGKSITLEFERIDETSIGVTASSGKRSVQLRVNRLGLVSRL
jgi:hypothetical protein